MREYVEDGTVKQFVLWSPVDLGYLTVHAAKLLHDEQAAPGRADHRPAAKHSRQPWRSPARPAQVFDRENIGQYDF